MSTVPTKEDRASLIKIVWEALQFPEWTSDNSFEFGKAIFAKATLSELDARNSKKFNLIFTPLTQIADFIGNKIALKPLSKEKRAWLIRSTWEALLCPNWTRNIILKFGESIKDKKPLKDMEETDFNLIFPFLTQVADKLGATIIQASEIEIATTPQKTEPVTETAPKHEVVDGKPIEVQSDNSLPSPDTKQET